MKNCLLGFLFFFLILAPINAEEPNSSPAADVQEDVSQEILKTDLIWQKARLDEEIVKLKASYQAQLENYLYQEKLYRIAYDQHKQLQTLVSIEDLTQKAKNLGLIRDEVLISYLDLLRLNLIATEGIELSLKNQHLNQLETNLVFLKEHREQLQTLNEREAVAGALTNFSLQNKNLASQCQEVLVLLTIGNLQMIYDKAFVLKQDIDLFLTDKGNMDLPAISRASDETNRSLNAAKLKLDDFWSNTLRRSQSNGYLANFYDDLPRVLNPIYVNLSQSIAYLNELLSI